MLNSNLHQRCTYTGTTTTTYNGIHFTLSLVLEAGKTTGECNVYKYYIIIMFGVPECEEVYTLQPVYVAIPILNVLQLVLLSVY